MKRLTHSSCGAPNKLPQALSPSARNEPAGVVPTGDVRAALERTVARVRCVNAPGAARRNELDRDRSRLDGCFVPNGVHMSTAWIDETHALRVQVRDAVRIVTLVRGDRPPP